MLGDAYMCQKTKLLLVKIMAATYSAARQHSEAKMAYSLNLPLDIYLNQFRIQFK